jgi:hypothetical protein
LTPEVAHKPAVERVTDYKTAVADLFTQLDLIDERTKSNQSETERLRAETWVMLAQMPADYGLSQETSQSARYGEAL